MKTLRRLMILSVLLLGYSATLIALLWPWLAVVVVIGLVASLARKGALTAFGTARWADISDIPHLLQGNGLILGHIAGRPSKASGIRGLFSRWLPDKQAVERLLSAFQRKSPKPYVRLSTACHTMVVAPTSVGKGVSCVIPFLLTNPDSCVVVDFKGELAAISAKHRQERFGHKIVIIDPYHVVTQ